LRQLVITVTLLVSLPPVVMAGQSLTGDCAPWQECRDRALDARGRGEFERFHDLAWRAVQTGPKNDPALMYLLARAQALSGRRRDALIMLRRLADSGVATDAAADEDFRRTRELAGWAELERTFERLRSGPGALAVTEPARPAAAPPLPPPAAAERSAPGLPERLNGVPPAAAAPPAPIAPAAPPAAPKAALTIAAAPATELTRFSTDRFSPAGLAYDEVSRRFLFGDALGRRLFVVGEGSSRAVDLVRAEGAGFHDVTALAIDARRGDLWVTSTAANGTAGAIHRLQLISGRALATFEAPSGTGLALHDVAVATNGTVLVLDSGARRILRLRNPRTPDAKSVDTAMPLDVADASSLAVTDSDRFAYVAHANGIARLDLQSRTSREVTTSTGVSLANFERIRWHRNSLVGVQVLADGSRGLVVLRLNRAGNAVSAGSLIDPTLDREARSPLLTIVGDDVYLSVLDGATPSAEKTTVDVVVRRIRLP
jgi:hypothetical protein